MFQHFSMTHARALVLRGGVTLGATAQGACGRAGRRGRAHGGLPIRRLRGELSGSERSVPRPCAHGFTPRCPAGPAGHRDGSPTPVLAVQEVRRPTDGVRRIGSGTRSRMGGAGTT